MNNQFRHCASLIFGITLLVTFLTGPVTAQNASPMAEAECEECFNLPALFGPAGPERAHMFGYSGAGIFWNYMDCHAFNACHTFDQPKYCADFHWVCGAGSLALDETRSAVQRGDPKALVDLVSATNSLVTIVGDHAIVSDCDRKTILGSVRIPAGMQIVAQASSPATAHIPSHRRTG